MVVVAVFIVVGGVAVVVATATVTMRALPRLLLLLRIDATVAVV